MRSGGGATLVPAPLRGQHPSHGLAVRQRGAAGGGAAASFDHDHRWAWAGDGAANCEVSSCSSIHEVVTQDNLGGLQ
jgi:hypothetical protein